MSVGTNIKKAFAQVGTTYTIRRDSGNFSGETLIYEAETESRLPFDREHFINAMLAYDTIVIEGDLLELSNGERVLVANKTPDMFKDADVLYEARLYKCNISSGELFRPSGEVWSDQTYHKDPVWTPIKTGLSGLIVETSGVKLSNQEELGLLSISKLEFYSASGEDLRVMDRLQVRSGEYYLINAIKRSIFAAINISELTEDTR